MTKCDKCGMPTYDKFNGRDHTAGVCNFYKSANDMKAESWVEIDDCDDVNEIVNSGEFPVKISKWMINQGSKHQGHIRHIYTPKWVKESIIMYHQHKYYDMSLIEFLHKMHK